MAAPLNLVIKSATEYRVGSPDGRIETAEKTTILTLVSLVGGHAVCEKNGGRIFIPSGSARRPRER